jgi:DNA modification methylase
MTWRLLCGDAREKLRELPERSVQTCVTSPPYFALRSYGGGEQEMGTEATPDAFAAALVEVFREVRRVLRDDGTVWLNLGDSYAANRSYQVSDSKHLAHDFGGSNAARVPVGCKPKDLIGVPWLVAFALRADGWYLRSEIIWHKPSPMPESVTDRPTRAHEQVFLLSKQRSYFYDAEAVREVGNPEGSHSRGVDGVREGIDVNGGNQGTPGAVMATPAGGRNKRSVWTVATQAYKAAHFATFPEKLVEPCILAGSAPDDIVLDPFAGSGTTGVVALRHGRSFVGIDLNPEYLELARRRICDDAPLFNTKAELPQSPAPTEEAA